ncbi:MAG: T9SS type A sorting domain-containing protein [Bacteroidia bacterium]|nr:T9SS type A sorting domain-containing protein [Bacteroidia bacterium]
MIRTLFLAISIFLYSTANAQNQNWTATGVDGTFYDIDAMVDSGRTVLVDISAYWCGPCWDWTQKGVMEKIYKEFGPEGTDDLRIIFIDADPGSNMANLQGAGLTSQGNWLATLPYPIIGPNGQGNSVANNYGQVGYPTLFIHCPGDTVGVEIALVNNWEVFLETWRTACPLPFNNGSTDAMLLHNESKEFCPGAHPVTDLYNQGTSALQTATLELWSNGVLLDTKNWTGNLAPFQHEKVSFDNYTMTTAMSYEKKVIVAGDMNQGGNIEMDSPTLAPQAPSTELTFDLQCDAVGAQTKWKLYYDNDSVFASNPPTNYSFHGFYTYDWTLSPNTCYNFVLFDTIGGDGICCEFGQGYYKIRETADTLSNFIFGGSFTALKEERKFYTPGIAAGLNESGRQQYLNIYPNPTTGIFKLKWEVGNPGNVRVLNILGETVYESPINETGEENIDISSLHSGVYFIIMTSNEKTLTNRIVISK